MIHQFLDAGGNFMDTADMAPTIGVRTPEQLEDNLDAVGWEFTDEEPTRLNEVSAVEKGYPYRMIRAYGSRKNCRG
jgi:aryl-alcohol dehydrogenase-like predicted oxidoreductase